jgi:hypothetical protein
MCITIGFFYIYSLAVKRLPFSRLQIPLADFSRPLMIANSPSLKGTYLCIKGNPFVMHKRLREPACDSQSAKGKPQKLITSGFSEHSANYAVFSAMYIKILSSKY